MANSNPIKLKDDEIYENYHIPIASKDKKLFISLKLEIETDKWFLHKEFKFYLNGNPISFQVNDANNVVKNEIGAVSAIVNKNFDLVATALRINNGDENYEPPLVKISMIFLDEDDNEYDSFSIKGDHNNPSKFYVSIKFIVI